MGSSITWGEYGRLLTLLSRDPATWLHAELAGWDHPVSREWMALYRTDSLLTRVHARRGTPLMEAPWETRRVQHRGTPAPISTVRARLDALHTMPVTEGPHADIR